MRLGREFSRLWLGNAASNLSDGIAFAALPLLAAALTDDPRAVAGLTVASTLPRLLTELGIGVVIDRVARRRLLRASNLVRASLFALLAVLVLTGMIQLWSLYLIFAVIGIAELVSDSTVAAVIPQTTGPHPHALDAANSCIAGAQTLIDEFVGPPLGGLLFAAAAFLPFGANTVAALIATGCFLLLTGRYAPQAPPEQRTALCADLGTAVRWAHRQPVIGTLNTVTALASIGYMIPFSHLVLFAREKLGLGPVGYVLLLSVTALGGLGGAVIAGPLRRWLGYGWAILAMLLMAAITFVITGVSSSVIVVAVALAIYILHAVVWNVLAASLRQRLTPEHLMGRIGAVTRLASLSGLTIGAVAGGILAEAFGLRMPFLIAAAIFTAAAAAVVPVIRRFDAAGGG